MLTYTVYKPNDHKILGSFSSMYAAKKAINEALKSINSKNRDVTAQIKNAKWRYLRDQAVYTKHGVNMMRTRVLAPGHEHKHFGNPFSHKDIPGLVKEKSVRDAVESFHGWLVGNDSPALYPGQRKWIWKQINAGYLDHANLLYDLDMNSKYTSHAGVIKDLVYKKRSKGNSLFVQETYIKQQKNKPLVLVVTNPQENFYFDLEIHPNYVNRLGLKILD
jgi:hypothetical protein